MKRTLDSNIYIKKIGPAGGFCSGESFIFRCKFRTHPRHPPTRSQVLQESRGSECSPAISRGRDGRDCPGERRQSHSPGDRRQPLQIQGSMAKLLSHIGWMSGVDPKIVRKKIKLATQKPKSIFLKIKFSLLKTRPTHRPKKNKGCQLFQKNRLKMHRGGFLYSSQRSSPFCGSVSKIHEQSPKPRRRPAGDAKSNGRG